MNNEARWLAVRSTFS
jgi:hypothetical protein